MKLLSRITRARSGLLELAGVAVVLALAINLVASGVVAWLGLPTAVFVGAGLAVITLVGIALVQFRSREETVEFHGFLPFYDGQPVRVKGYRLANDVERALRAVRAENKALEMQWDEGPIVLPVTEETVGADRRNLDGGATRLVREALEYVLLERLSMHLGDYFDRDPKLAKHTKELVREDLLALLPQNRVLDVLSRPVEERFPLVDQTSRPDEAPPNEHRVKIIRRRETTEGVEETVVSVLAGDYMYSRFDLTVPDDVTVRRIAPGCIRLDGKFLQTELGVRFDGFGYNLDRSFIDGYLRQDAGEFHGARGDCWSAQLTFSSRLRWRGIFSARSWRMHRWAEAFAEEANEDFDGASFLESINWKSIAASIHTQTGLRKRDIKRAEEARKDSEVSRDSEEASRDSEETGKNLQESAGDAERRA